MLAPPQVGTEAAQVPDLLMAEEDDGSRDTSRLKTQVLGHVIDNYLCINLYDDSRDAMAVPEAGPYKAMITYAGGSIEDPLSPAMPTTVELGSIMRDGTNVRIPFLTINERHHQRLVIMNRGGDAYYDMSFMTEDGRTVMAGEMASGMLPGGEVTTLSLRNDDIVRSIMNEDGNSATRTAATLSIEALERDISVSSVIHSPSTGNTDTVVLQK